MLLLSGGLPSLLLTISIWSVVYVNSKKSVLDYTDGDIEKLFDEWEVSNSSSSCIFWRSVLAPVIVC